MTDDQPDLVDVFYHPFVRPLGNLVITFALAEAALLDLVAEMHGQDELRAVATLKSQDAEGEVLTLARSLNLTGYDRDELLRGIGSFWADKKVRNRLVHDEWFPNLLERGTVETRGLTRTKTPDQVFGRPDVADIWTLVRRFQEYSGLFHYHAYTIRREREAD